MLGASCVAARAALLFRVVRPSEESRGRAVSALQHGYATGSLQTDTFSERLDCALRTSSQVELRGLTADLPAPWWRAALERGRAAVARRPPVAVGSFAIGERANAARPFDRV
jgi:hypothetical protein